MDRPFEIKEPDRARGFLLLFKSKTARHGEACFGEGRVSTIECELPGVKYRATIEGSHVCKVHLSFTDTEGWEGKCTCPEATYCTHVYAAMKALLAENSVAQVQALSSGAARPAVKPKPKPPAASASPEIKVPAKSEPALAETLRIALGRDLLPKEEAYLARLDKVYARCRATLGITVWEFADLGFQLPGYSWDTLKIWPVFPEDIGTFWLYLAQAAEDRHLAVPEFMRPMTNLAVIREKMRHWLRYTEIDRWKQTLTQSLGALDQWSATDTREVDLRLRVTATHVALECKYDHENEFQVIDHKRSRSFLDDWHAGRIAFAPQAEVLWQLYNQPSNYRNAFEFPHHDAEGARILGRALRQPLLEGRVVREDGQPFPRAAEPLRWSMQPAQDAAGDYRLTLTRADGAPAPPLLVSLEGRPPLYLSREEIFTGPPVQAHLLNPAKENSIPAPALETVEGVRLMRHFHLEPPPRLRDRIQHTPLRVAIHAELILPTAYSRSEQCVVRVSAEAGDGSLAEQWDGFTWTRSPKHPPRQSGANGGEPIVFYDRSHLQEVPRVMAPLNLIYDHSLKGLSTRVSRTFPETFAAWVKTVPPHFQLHLTGDLASLALGTVAGRVRLEATETDIDWFDLKVVVKASDTELTDEELKLLLDAKGGYVRLEGKGWRRMAFDLTDEEDERLARLGLNPHELTSEPQRLHALQLADKAARKFLPEDQAEKIARRAGELKARVTPPLPAGILAKLRPYQIEGFHFLAYLSANRFGGILADDMGLGKTLQALGWLLWLREQPGNVPRPSLVVCPKSVMDNWQAEAKRFAPGLTVRVWAAAALDQFVEKTGEAGVQVINYSQLRMLGESLAPVHWLAVILDEGQYIKNPNSQTAQAARALRASHRLVLSGTPIENRLMDLWSLMSFSMPGVLGSRYRFGRLYDGKNDKLARRRLAARVRPFLLRRTKSQVARDLPDKIEEDLFCELEGEQKTLYRAELKVAQQLLLKIKTKKQLAKQQFNFLASLLRLRQICCHPALVKPDSIAESAKVNALVEQLEPLIEEGQKVLVFSQFVELLDLLRPVLEAREWPLFYLTGATENRGDLVHRFQNAEGAAVFLISLKAGGFGLNLTAASYVILFDPWWNPAVENQAIDRTHRIGQVNKVIAYRLLIKDSVEEKIRIMQRQKSQLSEDVLGEEKFAQSLTFEDMKFLLDDA